ncbi:LamG domain-containing protein [Haloferula rosea]|uniref:LamG domain-containing protein n=1 Tax=Haloferula rosea TaxID=490093 RepID=A0A934VG22_9BACT|nr:LamG domain-containing protein [Haloferula rosea]MBK1827641.1 LamG domain-containing protein [Haloferula rosea]
MKTTKPILITLAACLPVGTASAQLSSNLIGLWEFEGNLTEVSGAHAGNLHDGTWDGTGAYTSGPPALPVDPGGSFGQALDLDGSNGVFINNTSNVDPSYAGTFDADIASANAITISFWAQGTPATWNPFVCKFGELSEGWQVRKRGASPNATFTLQGTGGAIDPVGANTAANDAGWKHFVAVWDGVSGTRKLYVNGVEDSTMTIAAGDTAPTGGPGAAVVNYLTFGMRDAGSGTFGNNFTGQIDDVAIWSRALTELEILHVSTNAVSDAIASTDTDSDGLFDDDEATLGTLPNNPDTDGDGVDDFTEVKMGTNPLSDDDDDMDGLLNSEENTGSANPWTGSTLGSAPGDTTDWMNPDSDGDGVDDGDEISLANGYVTNPNDADTDDDFWFDGLELAESTNPLDDQSFPAADTGLIGYWEFENNLTETSGTHTGGLHDGTADGTIAYVAGQNTDFGQALALDGSNGVFVNNSANTEGSYATTFDADVNAANALSISFWANGAVGQWSPFLCKHGEGVEGWQVRRNNRNAFACMTLRSTGGPDDPAGLDNTAATANTGWKHILAVWDGANGTRRLYVNGVEDTSHATTVGSSDFSQGGPGNALDKLLTFGMRDGGAATFTNRFNGQLDDIAIWKRVVTPTEVAQLSLNPLSKVLASTDSDNDGLFDDDEVNIHMTNPNEPDTDFDGVGDLEEVLAGSDPTADNDFDLDGLSNLQETSGSANPWTGPTLGTAPGDTTDWAAADSDLDGIPDGEEVVAGADGYVTNPNDADLDDDGWVDGTETNATPPTDPTDDQSFPTEWLRGFRGNWQFDNDLTDSGFLGLDGSMLGTVSTETYATGKFGQAIDLDKANNQRVLVSGDENYFDIVGGDITVSAWVQVEALDEQWQAVVAKGESTWRLARRHNTVGAAFAAGTSGDVPAQNSTANANPINDGNWHHLVGVAEAGVGISLYLDGYLVEFRGDAIPNALDTAASVLIGANPDSLRTWNGNIDDVAIWKRVLTPEEIYEIYGNGENVEYLIANDVTPGPVPDKAVVVESFGFDVGGNFNLTVSGLTPSKTYQMRVTSTLDGTDWEDVGDPYTGGSTNTFTEVAVDVATYPKSFYQVFEVEVVE